jgi:hypothetical protein
MTKIGSKNSLYPHRYFTKHLVDAFGKSPRESDLSQETLSLLIWQLKNHTGDHLQRFTHSKILLGDELKSSKTKIADDRQ